MVAQPFRPYFAGWAGPWEFADAETTAKRLRDAGFEDIQTSAVERPVQLSTFAECRDFMEHVIFGTHLERIDRPELRAAFVERLAEQSAEDDPPFHLEYRRLNLAARRPVH
jgi:hypothetical protein